MSELLDANEWLAPATVSDLTEADYDRLRAVLALSPEAQERARDENRLLFARWLVEQGKLSELLEGGDA
jgi:hypothetical protein